MPDLITTLTNAEYHAHPAMSNSRLSRFIESPRLIDVPMEETDAMRFGTLIHTALLEPDTLEARTIVAPADAPKRPDSRQLNAKKPSDETLKAIAFWEEFNANAIGREVITAKELQYLRNVQERIARDPIAGPLLAAKGNTESSLFWDDPITGVQMRCRPDFWREDGIIVDVKKTADCSSYGFGRSCLEFGYDRQAAIYTDGITAVTRTAPKGFVFLAIEGNKDWTNIKVQAHSVEQVDLDNGRRRRDAGLADYVRIKAEFGPDTSKWPDAIAPAIKPLRIPYHYLND